MKKIVSVLFLFSSILVLGQMNFEQAEWEEVLEKAKKENKIVFLEAYASWSEPCQLLEKYTFSDLEVANFFNDTFLNVRLDMEKYPGIGLAEKYEISIYPTLLFVNGSGKVIHRGCGAMEASELLELGRTASSENNWEAFNKKFDEGERGGDFMISYLTLMEDGCLNAEGFAQQLLSKTDFKNLTNENSFVLMEAFQWNIFSREFQYMLGNMEEFEAALGKSRVHDKIFNTFLAQYQEIYVSEELHLFAIRAFLDQLSNASFIGSDTLMTMTNLHYSEITEDWELFSETAITWVGMSGLDEAEELNELAWKFYLFVDNKEKLKIASSWVKEAIDNNPTPSSIDTYASLQFKLGFKKKAIELEKQAIVMAIELQEDVAHYEHQLKTFQGE